MSVIFMGDIAGCLNIQHVTLLQPPVGDTYNSRGRAISSGPDVATHDVPVDIQPASGRTLLLVPEGERIAEHVSVWFTQVVDTTSEALAQKAVKMVFRGFIWKCVAVPGDWRENGFQQCLFQNTKAVYNP